MITESKHLRLNEKKWDKWAKSYDDKGLLHDKLRQAQSSIVNILDIKENVNFLDVGCGTGYAVGEAAKLVNGKGEFYGVDLSSKMIEKAKANFNSKDNFHFITANAESIPLDKDFFDIIICTNSFHHYLHPDKALNEFYRLLKRGGKVYILDPTADKWYTRVIEKIIKLVEPEHVKLYSTKEFHRLFSDAGFNYSTLETKSKHDKIHIGEKK
jgi:ubiquinone/menaquinone biosynthesis C-methylase UbiE